MYLILNFFLQNIINVFTGMTISFCLTPKHSRICSLAIYTATGFFIYIFKFSSFDNQMTLQISTIFLQITLIIFTLLAFNDSLYKKLVCFSITFLCNMMVEFAALTFLESFASYTLALEPNTTEFTLALLLVFPLQIILYVAFVFFWNYTMHKNNAKTFFTFSLIPMLQLFTIACVLVPSYLNENTINIPLLTICSLIALFAIIVLLYYILRRQEKQSIEADYLELQALYQIESEYYEALENRNEELSKIRHDYNNQLATLYVLISSNKIEAAKEMTASLKNVLKD